MWQSEQSLSSVLIDIKQNKITINSLGLPSGQAVAIWFAECLFKQALRFFLHHKLFYACKNSSLDVTLTPCLRCRVTAGRKMCISGTVGSVETPEWAAKPAPIHEKAGGSAAPMGSCEGRLRIRLGLPTKGQTMSQDIQRLIW